MSKQKRGFALLSPEKQREIASKGGRAAQKNDSCHRFEKNSEEARAAGKKGGAVVSSDAKHMAEIGRLGGEASGRAKRKKKETT